MLIDAGRDSAALPTLSALRETLLDTSANPNPFYYEAVALANLGDTDRAKRVLEEGIERLESPQTVRIITRVGRRLPLYAGSAGKAMLAQALAPPEPGENHGNAAANRLPLGKPAALAQKQHRRLGLLLEVGDVSPMQIDLRRAPAGADFQHRQIALAIKKGHAPERARLHSFAWFTGRHNHGLRRRTFTTNAAVPHA